MRRSKNRAGHDGGTLWISFSDLMSALMLIFVLILFYAVYQYYDMLEIKTAELLRQSGILDQQAAQLTLSQQELEQKESALAVAQQALDDKEKELDEQSTKLTQTEQALLLQQAKLVLQEDTLNSLQSRLADQEKALSAAQVSLDEALAAQQAQQALLAAQQTQMEAQQAQLDKLVGVKSAIIEELVRALADSNISGASVDDSGAIVFSSEMMFDVDSYTLKDVGKAFLDSFIPGYLTVLMSEQYQQYVSQIIIEGHTDTDGTFLKNMRLSQNRAYAVLRYILSDEFTGISEGAKLRLQKIVTVNGRSYSDPVYNADGASVNMAASRRVVIKFRMNDEEMVNEMLSILEHMN